LIQERVRDPNRERSMGVVADPFWCWDWREETREPVRKTAEVPRRKPEEDPGSDPDREPGEERAQEGDAPSES
jgi:hypothetical protein